MKEVVLFIHASNYYKLMFNPKQHKFEPNPPQGQRWRMGAGVAQW